MAPDLNSLPLLSPQTPQPVSPLVAPVLNILPSNTSAVIAVSGPASPPAMPVHTSIVEDNSAVGLGPGPIRHPRPLTAAELHSELEREQEAVVSSSLLPYYLKKSSSHILQVNRLTRELSMLRAAQNASVASNRSSVSGSGLPDGSDTNHVISGPSFPHPSPRPGNHNRSSSSTSSINRSRTASLVSATGMPDGVQSSRFPNHTSQSLSRQNSNISTSSSRPSETLGPAVGHNPDFIHSNYQPLYLGRRQSLPRRDTNTSIAAQYSPSSTSTQEPREQPLTSVPTTGRYEEAAYWRHELEKQKQENEMLKRRIRELEASKRNERRGVVERHDSVDTTASNQGSVYNRSENRQEIPRSPLAALDKEIVGGESAAGTAE